MTLSKISLLLALLLLLSFSGRCDDNNDVNDDLTDNDHWWEEECYWEEEYVLGETDLSDDPFIQLICQDRSEICPDIYEPVCITQCEGQDCERTASNSCNACSDPNVIAYTPGSCEVERTICEQPNLSATDIACTDIYEPVCAYWSTCTQEPCGQTAGNACQACLQQGASYHTPGECGTAV